MPHAGPRFVCLGFKKDALFRPLAALRPNDFAPPDAPPAERRALLVAACRTVLGGSRIAPEDQQGKR